MSGKSMKKTSKTNNNFFETGFGWLTPKGKVIGGEAYDHINILWEDADLPQSFKEELMTLDDIHSNSIALIDDGNHPEWHVYEMALDDFICDVYNAGYIRLGFSKHFGLFEVEGNKKVVESRMDLINRIKDRFEQENDIEFKLRVQTWGR